VSDLVPSDLVPSDVAPTAVVPLDEQPTMLTSAPLYPALPEGPRVPPQVTSLAAAPEPGAAAVVPVPLPAAATELVSCPECGTTAMVTLNRRDSRDFCRNCDYPLFWTPSRVLTDRELDANDQALRRLPGTVGRATVASLICPHPNCGEPNPVTAQTCVRCGLPLHVVAPPPPPPVVYVPPPPAPVLAPEPEQRVAWWVWALIGVGLAITVVLVVLILTGHLG
jgi:hypothetical protein